MNVQVRFFTDTEGMVPLAPAGIGSRNIVATNQSVAYEGNPTRSTSRLTAFQSAINNGTFAAAADATWYELGLGGGLGQVTITATANVTPGGAVTYRIFVESAGASSAA